MLIFRRCISMRSYYEHLQSTDHLEVSSIAMHPIPPRPITRSSAIFPMIQFEGVHSRLLFMGYWILKRNLTTILAVITLRSDRGETLNRQSFHIKEPKLYRLELSDQLEMAGLDKNEFFVGSLEVEFYSTENFFYPYPAVVVNYYGKHFCSVVHTSQRIFNDFDDKKRNSENKVPESGFNIYADETKSPFMILINGPETTPYNPLDLEFFNLQGYSMKHTLQLGTLAPYETKILYLARLIDLKPFLLGSPGTLKANFNLEWAFPRLVVGNIELNLPAMSITHTYYDCSQESKNSDYWNLPEKGCNPASLMVPVLHDKNHFTNIYFYPIYSPSSLIFDVAFYDMDGKRLEVIHDAIKFKSPFNALKRIELKPFIEQFNLETKGPLAAKLIAHPVKNSRLPARIKIGLDIGGDPQYLPTNICINLQPCTPRLNTKTHSFRWAPILTDQPHASVWIMNSSPEKSFNQNTEVDIHFYRESDLETLTRHITLPPHGFTILSPQNDPEIKNFLEDQIGWITLHTTNPYTTLYYFAENPSGIIGGDHGF